MKLDDIKRCAVVGAGAMGAQIAEVLSRTGHYEVRLVDVDEDVVNRGLESIDKGLERFFVAKGKITAEEKKAIMERITGGTSLEQATADVDFAIEAIPEILGLKRETFERLDASAPADTVLASNTSTLNITEIGAATNRPDKVVGMHFFNPVAVMKLVEVVKGAMTSEETVEVTKALAARLGKEPVVCRDTSYGFLANRAYEALREEALQIVWEKVASPEDVDKSLKLGYNLPLGPLELGDRLGSWKRRAEMERDRMAALGPEKGRIHPLIRVMVRAGYFGGPGQKGIYDFWKEVLSKW
ncbi:MAG: 3-hydroxyacyl-CoA dehydrogenase family protein [Deltaproteobacteria bacterium]|nr:3-hydroxyacyl-CoA dehydrogenase family protein [Deltaproteobacteria bacterium]MBW2138264.1 3-hydroxyacyl-CoA dehydrogenase family protein [Deltaproteobacteria bacterium]